MNTRHCCGRLLLCLMVFFSGTALQAAPLPTEAFARPPQVQDVALSPDGTWFAAMLNRDEDSVVIARPLDGSAPPRALLKSDNRESNLAWVHWLDNQRLVISVRYPAFRGGSVPTVESRLVAVGRDGSKPVTLVEPSELTWGSTTQFADQVVDWLPGDGHHILLQAGTGDGSFWPAVYRVDTDTGRREPVHGRIFGVRQWLTDATHRVRVGLWQQGTQIEVRLCDADGEHWRTAWRYELFGRDAVLPLGFGKDPNQLYISADHEGRRAIFEVDLRDPALPRRLLLADPLRDVPTALLQDPASGRVVGVRGTASEGMAGRLWDADTQTLARGIDQALAGRFNRLLQFSTEGGRYLLYSGGNGLPGQFMVGDRAGGTLSLVGKLYPQLPPELMVRKQADTVTARDGLRLPVLLTLPPGVPAQKLPTVLLPHGGPISSDGLDFDPLAQFLAQRGYAVLQVNFRGSSGQGYDFMRAGLKRWGLEMQDDLTDALQWLTQRGVADPARVCIVGGSYGGYAALMGGATTPDLYRCVVSIAGVSDLPALAAYQSKYVNGGEVFSLQVGGMFSDRAQLEATSPARLAASFKAPVLLLHGTQDRSVPYAQSQAMADALKQAGKDVRLVTLERGDHSMTHAPHRLQVYRALEDFLAQHLGSTAPR